MGAFWSSRTSSRPAPLRQAPDRLPNKLQAAFCLDKTRFCLDKTHFEVDFLRKKSRLLRSILQQSRLFSKKIDLKMRFVETEYAFVCSISKCVLSRSSSSLSSLSLSLSLSMSVSLSTLPLCLVHRLTALCPLGCWAPSGSIEQEQVSRPQSWLSGPRSWLSGPQSWLSGPQSWLSGP